MSRPLKTGVNYFPLDVDLDTKMDFIESRFANDGFAVIIKLWQKIYSENGYYCEWNEDVALLFSFKKANHIDAERLNDIIKLAIERKLFSKELYEKYGILTSEGIQKRYLEITERRRRVDIDERYLLIDIPSNSVNVYINGVNVYNNSKNADNNSQSKAKESKGNKSRVNERGIHGAEQSASAPDTEPPIISIILNDKSLYGITQKRIEHWAELYPSVNVLQELRKMQGWSEANPTKRKTRRGVERFITSWLAKEQDRGGNMTGYQTSGGARYGQNQPDSRPEYNDSTIDRLLEKGGFTNGNTV